MSFRDPILHTRQGRIYLMGAIALSLLLFFVFKILYPYPNMIMDSYVYLRPLVEGQHVSAFPMGYTWFIGLVGLISRSATVLVWVQYLFLEMSFLLFYYTILYFFQPAKWSRILLFVFLFCNPLFMYAGNLVMSDTLFTTLSILWLTQMIWIFFRPRLYMILLQALLLLLVFSVRYNALYYPFVGAIALFFVRIPIWQKLAGIGLQIMLIGSFVLYTMQEMRLATQQTVFSPFGAWRMANNALYMYGHVCLQENKPSPVPPRFGGLDSMVRRYFNAIRWVDDQANAGSVAALYAGDPTSPLVIYKELKYGPDSVFMDLRTFSLMAPEYSAYGVFLVKKYPFSYIKWFLWPSLIRYLITPQEVFSSHTPFYLREDTIGKEMNTWFRLKTLTVAPSLISVRDILLSPYSILKTLIHLAFFIGMTGFFFLGGLKRTDRTMVRAVIFIAAVWIIDLFFKVTAGAVALRHQMFIMVLEFSFVPFFFNFIYHKIKEESSRPILLGEQGVSTG